METKKLTWNFVLVVSLVSSALQERVICPSSFLSESPALSSQNPHPALGGAILAVLGSGLEEEGPRGVGVVSRPHCVSFHLLLPCSVRYPFSQLCMWLRVPIPETLPFTLSRGETSNFLPRLGQGSLWLHGAGVGI